MSYNYSPILNIMLKAARKSSRILIRDYGEIFSLQNSSRNIANFIEVAKVKVRDSLVKELGSARDEYSMIIDNEDYYLASSAYSWIIKTIDGVFNFSHALPNFSLSIGLAKKTAKAKSEIIAVVVEAPILGETYFAEKGTSAWLVKHSESTGGNFRLRVSTRKDQETAIIALLTIDKLLPSLHNNIRVDGTHDLALAYLAAGRYDAVIGNEEYILSNPASLLVSEAGGLINSSFADNTIIASNNKIKLLY